MDEILAQKEGGNTYYLTKDGLGSTREVVSASDEVLQRYDYDAFGAVTVQDASGNPITNPQAPITNYLFTGREYQQENGLYNYRNRFYHPTLGRFLQTDPIGYGDGLNLYSYGLNNSLYWIDPYGLAIEIRVAPGWGNSNLNHVYIWSTKYNKGRGRSGVSGKRDSDGTNLKEYEVVDVITDLNGYSEEEFKVPGTRT